MLRKALISLIMLIPVLVIGQDLRDLSAFNELYVSRGVRVKLINGDLNRAKVVVEGGISSEVVTEITGSLLTIRFKEGSRQTRKANVTLYYDGDLNRLRAESGGVIFSSGAISADRMIIEGETGGKISARLEVEDLTIDIGSGSLVALKGFARAQDTDVSSGAELRAFDLESEEISADCSAGGSMEIYAVSSLTAKCVLGGKIVYAGSPSVLDKEELTSGKILPRDD